jgi:hypothetical protein
MVRTLAGGLQMNPPVRRRKNQYIPPIQTAKPARSIRHQPAKLLRRSPNSRTACRMPARDLALSLSHTLETGERAPGHRTPEKEGPLATVIGRHGEPPSGWRPMRLVVRDRPSTALPERSA